MTYIAFHRGCPAMIAYRNLARPSSLTLLVSVSSLLLCPCLYDQCSGCNYKAAPPAPPEETLFCIHPLNASAPSQLPSMLVSLRHRHTGP